MSTARLWIAAALALAATGCSLPSWTEADAGCLAYRGWFPQHSSISLWDDCVRHLGETWCRRCLVQ